MKRMPVLSALAVVSAFFVFGVAWRAAAVEHAESERHASPITQQQIEADWLRQAELRGVPAAGGEIRPEDDAAGACDAVKNGEWGFHTDLEENPWWQVDLGGQRSLVQIQIYNRCDTNAERAARLMILLSDDGKKWKQVYQHDGTVFYGYTDNKPLLVQLGDARARYVRIQLPGKTYLHLDEVEVYRATKRYEQNVALLRPATQSSTSRWSSRAVLPTERQSKYSTAKIVEQGRMLAQDLRRLGADVEAEAESLDRIAERLKRRPADAPEPTRRGLYLQVRQAVRKMAMSNPLLDFDTILFAKRAPGALPHMSDQYYGWWSRPGGGIFLLSGWKSEKPQARCLTADMPEGSFLRPDLSYDGKKVLFAYCRYHSHVAGMEKVDKERLPDDAFYHIYEMNVDGTGRRQLTRGPYDDFDARYLPNGRIVFLSTRKGQFVQCGKLSTLATQQSALPDSYVRCGGSNTRPVPVYTLHVMESDGTQMQSISAFENFEWTPFVADDGRILYARWDYIDRHNHAYMSLWSTNPDGTNPQLVYGNYTATPHCIFEARPIPNSQKLVFTASAHHSITGGTLALLDRNLGTEGDRPITRLTPELGFPETEGWSEAYYANPYPLSEEHYLVAWSDRRLPPHGNGNDPVVGDENPINALGLYLYDGFGNLELIYRDAEISSMYPIPVRPRPRPPIAGSNVDWAGAEEGRFLLQDVYRGLDGVQRGSVKSLRIVGVPPKTQPHMDSPELGFSHEDPGKYVLGTVPVEEDGSAHFRAPSGVSLFFQALDADGMAVQTMRTLTYVQPGQTLSCIGCHESRESAPETNRPLLAATREPSKIAPGPAGSWPLDFQVLVQPVMEQRCIRCHKPGTDGEEFDLTVAKSYDSLAGYGNPSLRTRVLTQYRQGRSTAGAVAAKMNPLVQLLKKDHYGVKLAKDDWDRLITWMDTYGQRRGSFSPQQEERLRKLRRKLNPMLADR